MAGRGDKTAAQSVHFSQRADLAGVTEIVCEDAPGKAGTGSGLYGDDTIISLASDHFSCKRRDETAQIGAASGASDDNIRDDMIFVKGCLCFQTDDCLMKQNLIQNAAQYITISFPGGFGLYSFRDSTSEAAGGAGMLDEDFASDFRSIAGRRCDCGAVCPHDFPAERFLLIGNFYHVYETVQIEIGTCHRECGAPLSCTGFGGDTFQSLFLGIISLGNGGIELVAAACIVSFEFIIDFSRSL